MNITVKDINDCEREFQPRELLRITYKNALKTTQVLLKNGTEFYVPMTPNQLIWHMEL